MNLDQNLLKNQPLVRKPAARIPGMFWLAVIDALSLCAAVAFGYLYRLFLVGGAGIWWLVGALGAFTLLAVLQSILTKNAQRRLVFIVLQVLAFLLPSYRAPLELLGTTVVLMVVFMLWGEWTVQFHMRSNLRIRFFTSVTPLINKIVTAAVLMAVVLYLPQLNEQEDFISERAFNEVFAVASGALSKAYPRIPFDSTVARFTEGVTQYQLETNPLFQGLPAAAKLKAVQVATAQMLNDWSQKLGVAIKPDESLSRALYHALLATLNHWKNSFGMTFLLGWAVIAFLIVRSVGFFFAWALAGIAFVVYELLLASNVIAVSGESALHEVITFT